MANIQMEYRVYSCSLDQEKICAQCFTSSASDIGCQWFHDGKREGIAPYGDCIHAVCLTNSRVSQQKAMKWSILLTSTRLTNICLLKSEANTTNATRSY